MTLIEMIIVAAISVIVMTALYAFVAMCARLHYDNYQYNVVDGEARKLADWLVSDTRQAVSILDSYVDTVPDPDVTYTSGPTTLMLKMRSIDVNGVPLDSDTTSGTHFDYIIYYADSNRNNNTFRATIPGAGSSRPREAGEGAKRMARSLTPEIQVDGLVQTQPDAKNAAVVNYVFRASRQVYPTGGARKNYMSSVSGAVYLRNKAIVE